MSDARKDGGRVFPSPEQPGFREADYGMTMRDYYIGQALLGLLSKITKYPIKSFRFSVLRKSKVNLTAF